jgi:serine/threonine protein kinase
LFESESRFKHIETHVLQGIYLSVIIPSSIAFIACCAAPDSVQISIARFDSCPEYGRWQRLRRSGLFIDFRRILRFGFGLPSLSDSLFNLSEFNEGSLLSESDHISTQIYDNCDDGHKIIVKSINLSACVSKSDLEGIIENLMNLRHPCIAGVIGVVLPSRFQGLKIVRKCFGSHSLSEILSTSPNWWTPTAKAKAVVGLVLGLRFVHSLGLLHGHVTGNNVFLDEDGVIQITDFCTNSSSSLEGHQSAKTDIGGFSGESWTQKADVQAFAGILSEIVASASAGPDFDGPRVPSFVSEIIERGQCRDSKTLESFPDIWRILKMHKFKIIEGVNVQEVSDFVNWIELSETLIE